MKKTVLSKLFSKKFKRSQKPWACIKSILTLKSKAKMSPNSLFVSRNIITNKTSIIETFNIFFVNVDSNLVSKIPKARNPFGKYLKKEF